MGKLIKLVVLVALVLFAYKVGLPWVQSQGFIVPGAGGDVNTEGWACVRQVDDVRDLCAELLSKAQTGRPIEFLGTLRNEVRSADRLCQCKNLGCAESKQALAILSEITDQMADTGRLGEVAMAGTPRLEKVDSFLEAAKKAAASHTSTSR